ncbi:isoprenylcysteine carboxylmethyltransferase family protein [Chryseobacterium taklimakanense]|uniref:methyltransferase family protein n=1 Tax=Chryseobacterium taklimakanense TaxID=536441 RepID=UPI000F5DDDD5|nr:isoprenylcysteine carboxylmethyltransferase family protein [Chryseobacterium taklimakanense]AZI22171.1 isoprenylcysteine carboxylmethyltransferase family protein [Chryseobacterium taklimakanense]
MIQIGNFFFKYRNFLFIILYLLLFIPSPPIFGEKTFGQNYYLYPIILGLLVTVTGQMIRGMTIGLAYIVRGGRDKKVYADQLVTEGIFTQVRNPLYVGNILMLLGVGILANSLIYVAVIMPIFLFIYQAIVLAEENFLRGKFGASFDEYTQKVHRWIPNLSGIGKTFSAMSFKWKRWLIKEYNTQFVWLSGIALILLFKYPQLTNGDDRLRNNSAAIAVAVFLAYYLFVRYMKKSKKWTE